MGIPRKIVFGGKSYRIFPTRQEADSTAGEVRASPANPTTWLIDWITGGQDTESGIKMNEAKAHNLAAFYAGVRLLSETIATLPLITYRRTGERSKERAVDLRLFGLLHDEPNPEMTVVNWIETGVAHLIAWGNWYNEIERNGDGQIIGLWPLMPDRTRLERFRGELRYVTHDDNGQEFFIRPENMLHVPGLGYDGRRGYSLVSLARQSLGFGLAMERYGASYFGRGARPDGVLQMDGEFRHDDERREFRRRWEEMHEGLDNSRRIAILEKGMKWQQITMSNEDSQFLDTRKFEIREIARWLRLPPHMIGDLDNATFTNIEQQSIEFVTYSLRPWLVRIEKAFSKKLIPQRLKQRIFIEFVVEGLLRGDIAAQTQHFVSGRQNGWYSANDIRDLLNLNPIPAEEGGDTYLIPLNMIPASQALNPDESIDEGEPDSEGSAEGLPDAAALPEARSETRSFQERRALINTHKRMISTRANRLVDTEARAVERVLSESDSVQDILAGLRRLYEDFPGQVRQIMRGVFGAAATETYLAAADEVNGEDDEGAAIRFADDYLESFSVRYIRSSHGQLRDIATEANDDDVPAAMQQRVNEWRESEPGKIGNREAVQLGAGVAKLAWRNNGIRQLQWRTVGENCPLCRSLNGKVISMNQSFVRNGDIVNPEDGETTPLQVTQNVGHPQLHQGCDCMILPVR